MLQDSTRLPYNYTHLIAWHTPDSEMLVRHAYTNRGCLSRTAALNLQTPNPKPSTPQPSTTPKP